MSVVPLRSFMLSTVKRNMFIKSLGLAVWLGLFMDMYVDIFDAVHVYIFHQGLNSKMSC